MSATELSGEKCGTRAVQGSYLRQEHASDPRAGCSTSSVRWRAAGAARWRTAPPDCPPAHRMTHQPARVIYKDDVQELFELEVHILPVLLSPRNLTRSSALKSLQLLSRPVSGDDECRLDVTVTPDVAAIKPRIAVQAATDGQLNSVRCHQMTWACYICLSF